jgi:uncharacterized membrane protein YfcA
VAIKEYFLLCGIIASAGFTQGLSGFGSVLVSLPLLVLFINIKTVVPLVCLLSLFIGLMLIVQLRHHLQWREILPLLLASLPGIPTGVYFLKTIDTRGLELILGVVLISFSIYTLCARERKAPLHTCWGYLAGFLAGCLGGSIGANGPPVIVYTSLQPWNKDAIKSTLVGYFFITGIGISGFHAASGLITGEVLKLTAIALPFLVIGVLIGSFCYRKAGSDSYRRVINLVLMILGLFMIGKATAISWVGH